MGIGPLELQGAISRTQDFAQMRHTEDTKVIADQSVTVINHNKEVENKSSTVERGDDASNNLRKFDASEKGDNEYQGDGGQKKKNKKDSDGKVLIKGAGGGFDIRI